MDRELFEKMTSFFDVRSAGYDEHMRANIEHFEEFYAAVADAIPPGDEPYRILDIGCGTGLELRWLWQRRPKAYIVGMDLSTPMLRLLKGKYRDHAHQLEVVQASYTEHSLGAPSSWDAVVSVMTVHHLLHGPKTALYGRIWECLKPGGLYVEGDYIVSVENERKALAEFLAATQGIDGAEKGLYHLDIPFSAATQRNLLEMAGFCSVSVSWQRESAAVLVAKKGGLY